MTYKCDIKFMAIPSRLANVVKLCNQLGLSRDDVAVDYEMTGKPLITSQQAFLLPRESGVTHRLVLQDDLILNPYIYEEIQVLVNRFPNNPIALYTYDKGEKIERGVYKMHFLPGPAILMPLTIMEDIRNIHKQYNEFPHDDWFYSWYCHRNNIKMLGMIPNLATIDLNFESSHGQRVLKRYINEQFSNEKGASSVPCRTDTYGDKYINLSDSEFKKSLEWLQSM